MKRTEKNIWKGMAAGLSGGLVAAAVMNQFQALWGRLAEGVERSHGAQSLQQGAPEHGVARELQERGTDEQQDDAAMRLANAVSQGVFDRELGRQEKHAAGTAVHYAFSVATGGCYGAVAEIAPSVTAGAGLPFGAFVWVTADEAIVPGLGLSKAPTEYPISTHLYALSSHLVYGLTTEIVRRTVRRALSSDEGGNSYLSTDYAARPAAATKSETYSTSPQ